MTVTVSVIRSVLVITERSSSSVPSFFLGVCEAVDQAQQFAKEQVGRFILSSRRRRRQVSLEQVPDSRLTTKRQT